MSHDLLPKPALTIRATAPAARRELVKEPGSRDIRPKPDAAWPDSFKTR
jgi:hypothetical protein